MGTKIAVVYGTQSGIMRRVIVPSRDKDLDDPALVGPGESMLVMKGKDAPNMTAAKGALVKHLGFIPHSGRTAVISMDGVVENVIIADPALYSIPDKILVLCGDDVEPGMTHDDKDGFKEIPPEPDPDEEVPPVSSEPGVDAP